MADCLRSNHVLGAVIRHRGEKVDITLNSFIAEDAFDDGVSLGAKLFDIAHLFS